MSEIRESRTGSALREGYTTEIYYQKGSRGHHVMRVQELLNVYEPSCLPALTCDGIYGTKTEARVREFQRTRSLIPTGSVDADTLWAITPSPAEIDETGQAFRGILMEYYSARPGCLNVFDREWDRCCDFLMPVGGPTVAIVGGVAVVALAFCVAIIAIDASAQNKQPNSTMGRVAAEEYKRITDSLNPISPQGMAVRLDIAQSIRRMTLAATKDLGERKRMCEDKTHPVERSPACNAALTAFGVALMSLNEKLMRLPGGSKSINLPFPVLVSAVLASFRALILALNAIGTECKCPFIIF